MPADRLALALAKNKAKHGYRPDGTAKGQGYLGLLSMHDGNQMSELSVGVNFDGKETLIPSLVPGLTAEELEYLAGGGDPRLNEHVMRKAVEHARKRLSQGQSPFYD